MGDNMSEKNQSNRLASQQKNLEGANGIFGKEAKAHDLAVSEVSEKVLEKLKKNFPKLEFRIRVSVTKKEINKVLNRLDSELGQTLFVENASIRPDGGILEVKDDYENWRVILVSEAKHQGKDIDNILNGILVGKKSNQDLMIAGNAIERSHKNIAEVSNFVLFESHFPYVLFLEGSNFLTDDIIIKRPDGRKVAINSDAGSLNRLDRLTAANYGMAINSNLCRNKFIQHRDKSIMLQAASIYTQGDGCKWDPDAMCDVMYEIAETSLQVLGSDLFIQVTKKDEVF